MTKQSKNRIAVVSSREVLRNFFAWEAEACACPVEVFSSLPQDLTAFDWIVADREAADSLSEQKDRRVVIVCDSEKEALVFSPQLCWVWPVSVRQVRRLYESGVTEELAECEADSYRQEQSPTLRVLSEKDRLLIYRNRKIRLTPKEWALLLCLGKGAGAIVPRERLNEELSNGEGNLTEVYICHLRRKLEEPFGIRLIKAERGKGYRLDARVIAKEIEK